MPQNNGERRRGAWELSGGEVGFPCGCHGRPRAGGFAGEGAQCVRGTGKPASLWVLKFILAFRLEH